MESKPSMWRIRREGEESRSIGLNCPELTPTPPWVYLFFLQLHSHISQRKKEKDIKILYR